MLIHRRRNSLIKIGIKEQLIVLVLFVALFCLTFLAIVTGVYYSSSYRSVRSDRLQIVAQMKASQLQQSLNTLLYQIYWLSSRDTVQKSLVSYRAGNTTAANFVDAGDTIRQFLLSTATVVSVKLYVPSAKEVFVSPSNWSSSYVPPDVINQLYTLDFNMSIANRNLLNSNGLVDGPLINSSTSYVMSMSLPIFTTSSILYDSSDLVGYMTATMSASSIDAVVQDITALENSNLRIISTNSSSASSEGNMKYKYVLPESLGQDEAFYNTYTMANNSYPRKALLERRSGYDLNTVGQFGEKIVVGYCPVDFSLTKWAAVVEQPRSKFMAPQYKLTKITVACCVGIAVFIVAITFPLAHWAVKPILRLQQATESIVQGRGLQKKGGNGSSGNTGGFPEKQPIEGSPGDRGSVSMSSYSDPITHTTTFTTDHSSMRDNSNQHHSSYIANAQVPPYSRIFEDELSKLTDTFNSMTDELDIQYSQLEHRVKARTKQLETAKIQAEAANEAKTVFIANISHELRTPLNGILGMTAIAMDETDSSTDHESFDIEKVRQSLKLIFRSGELLLHILTELLTFSKNSLKRSKLEKSEFVLLEVAQQINSIFGKLAKDQKVKLSISLEPIAEIRQMVLHGDSNRIIQVVMNLVSNALKFTPVDGDVKVIMKYCGIYDELRSTQAEYKEVFVVGQQRSRLEGDGEKCFAETTGLPPSPFEEVLGSSLDEKNVVTGSPGISDSGLTNAAICEDDDTHSIMTASTTSYDQNLFTKQFKNSTASPQPSLPLASSPGPASSPSPVTTTYRVFEFTIQDTGPGIDPSLHTTIFDPFIQGDQTLSRQYGGTGLGLSICRQLAEMMHGVMIMKSEVGKGSWFCFRVPLECVRVVDSTDEDVEILREGWEEFDLNDKRNRKVVIVEPKEEEQLQIKKRHNAENGETQQNDPGQTENSEDDQEKEVEYVKEEKEKEAESYFDRKILQSTGTANSIYSTQSNSNPGTPGGFVPAGPATVISEIRPNGPLSTGHLGNGTTTSTSFISQSTTINSTLSSSSVLPHRPLKILVAEDNIVNQEVIKRMLTLECQTDITMANNGQEAIDHIKANKENPQDCKPFDIIFMDVQMPLIDGLQATKVITQELHFTNPIVALTAFADESNVKGCIDAGMTGFLSKPIRRMLLRRILEEFCPVKEVKEDREEENQEEVHV